MSVCVCVCVYEPTWILKESAQISQDEEKLASLLEIKPVSLGGARGNFHHVMANPSRASNYTTATTHTHTLPEIVFGIRGCASVYGRSTVLL